MTETTTISPELPEITTLEGYLCVHNLLQRRVLTKTNTDFLTFVRYVARFGT